MKIMRLGKVFVFLCMFLGACAYNQYSFDPDKGTHERPAPSDQFCVMFPPDFEPGCKVYFPSKHENPAKAVGESIFIIAKAESPSSILLKASNEDSAVEECISKGGSYVLVPKILDWHGRASIWTMQTNHMRIRIQLLKAKPVAIVRTAYFQASDGWFNSGAYEPADILKFNDSWNNTILELMNRR